MPFKELFLSVDLYQPVYLHQSLSHLMSFLSLFLLAVSRLLTMEDDNFILGQLFICPGRVVVSGQKTRLFKSLNICFAVRQMYRTSLHKNLQLLLVNGLKCYCLLLL